MNPSERENRTLKSQIEKLQLKANLKEKLLGRALRDSELIGEKLVHKQEELRQMNAQLEMAKELLEQSFQRYVSAQIVDEILEKCEPVNLKGERKVVTILLSDIRGVHVPDGTVRA